MTHHLDIFMSGKNLGLNGLTAFLEYRHTNGNVQIFSSLSFLFGHKKTMFIPHSQQDWFDWLDVIDFLCVLVFDE